MRKDRKVISDEDYDFLMPKGCQLGILYGLPKIHKQGAPIRPIVSSINTVS